MSAAITHKREIIILYHEGYFTPEIAIKTNHNYESVDRYIKDYHRVSILWEDGITNMDQIIRLARLSNRVIQQYVDILPEKVRMSKNKLKNKLESDIKNGLNNQRFLKPVVI